MTRRILTLMLALVLALAVFVPAAFGEEISPEKEYYVYTENGKALNVRKDPNGDIIGKIPYGEKVRVISFISDNWAMISFQGEQAYVNRRFLIEIHPEELKEALEKEQEAYTGDPISDIDAEFASAIDVDDYKIIARPARVTSVVNMRWIPSETGRVIAQYKATEALVVLKETDHYLQVQDPDTGDVGYIHKKYAAK